MKSIDDDTKWHLDKKVPIALMATMGVQVIAFVWWAGAASNRLDQLERRVEAAAPQHERLIRLEEKVGIVQQGIAEIKQLIRPTIP
jgi:tetrahydromethanopterin S-methyltransferase subunit G